MTHHVTFQQRCSIMLLLYISVYKCPNKFTDIMMLFCKSFDSTAMATSGNLLINIIYIWIIMN